jgi:hypothetical protein
MPKIPLIREFSRGVPICGNGTLVLGGNALGTNAVHAPGTRWRIRKSAETREFSRTQKRKAKVLRKASFAQCQTQFIFSSGIVNFRVTI